MRRAWTSAPSMGVGNDAVADKPDAEEIDTESEAQSTASGSRWSFDALDDTASQASSVRLPREEMADSRTSRLDPDWWIERESFNPMTTYCMPDLEAIPEFGLLQDIKYAFADPFEMFAMDTSSDDSSDFYVVTSPNRSTRSAATPEKCFCRICREATAGGQPCWKVPSLKAHRPPWRFGRSRSPSPATIERRKVIVSL